jgi:hypothetical protein
LLPSDNECGRNKIEKIVNLHKLSKLIIPLTWFSLKKEAQNLNSKGIKTLRNSPKPKKSNSCGLDFLFVNDEV